MNILTPMNYPTLHHFNLRKKHFMQDVAQPKNIIVFEKETCERCGKACVGANSIVFVNCTVATAKAHGLKESEAIHNESSVDEDGDPCCTECYQSKAG